MIGVRELPDEGIVQGLLLLRFREGEESRLVTVPLSLVWL
jgi:hypothetical protein